MKIKKPRKRFFQLLEVMIAAFVLLLCVPPAIHIFINLFKEQQFVIKQNQRDHLAKSIHAAVVEKLYRRQFPLEAMSDDREYAVDEAEIKKKLDEMGDEATYKFSMPLKPKKRKKGALYLYLIDLNVHIKEKGKAASEKGAFGLPVTNRYHFLLYVESENPPEDQDKVEDEEMQAQESQVEKAESDEE